MHAAERAVDAGRMLIEASEAFTGVGWKRWVPEKTGIPYSTAREYMRLADAVAQGSLTSDFIAEEGRKAALDVGREKREKPVRPPIEGPGSCILGVRDVAALLDDPPGTIDWIVTDPPYAHEYLPLFETLARGAAHVLKPGGGLLCMCGETWLPDVIDALRAHLTYHWQLCFAMPGPTVQIFPRHIFSAWKSIFLFSKGEAEFPWANDMITGDAPDKEFHEGSA
jgi:hypothetical protein